MPRLSHLALLAIAFAGHARAQVAPCGAQVPDSAAPVVLEGRTTRDTVPGGMRVAILTRPSRCDSVLARVTVRFGDEITLADRVPAVRVLRKIVGLGTTRMTARAVRDSFARLGTTFTVAGSPSRISILLHTTPTYLAPALALTATLLRQPRFEPAAVDSIQADILTGLAEDSANVVDLASARLLHALSPYPPSHPLAALSPEQELRVQRRVTLADVRTVYSDLVGASFGDIAIVGTVPRQAVRDLVTRLFADWRSPQPFSLILRRPYDPPGTFLRLAVPSATTVLYQARRNVSVPVNSQEHAALVPGQYIFGGGFSRPCLAAIPAIAATERPTCDLVITLGEGVGDVTIRAAAKAGNIQALQGAIRREIDRVRDVGVSLEDVERAKSAWVHEQRTSRSRDDQLAVRLSTQWLAGRTFADDATFERVIAALTPAAVTAVVRQYLEPGRLTAIEAGPPDRARPTRAIPRAP